MNTRKLIKYEIYRGSGWEGSDKIFADGYSLNDGVARFYRWQETAKAAEDYVEVASFVLAAGGSVKQVEPSAEQPFED